MSNIGFVPIVPQPYHKIQSKSRRSLKISARKDCIPLSRQFILYTLNRDDDIQSLSAWIKKHTFRRMCASCHSCPKKNWVKSAVFSRKPLVFFFTSKLYHKSAKKSRKTYHAEFFIGKYFSVISYPPLI